jgi:hypothetical protein
MCPDRISGKVTFPLDTLETPSTLDPVSDYDLAPVPTPALIEKNIQTLRRGVKSPREKSVSNFALPCTIIPFYRHATEECSKLVGNGVYVHPIYGSVLNYDFDLSK